jgi:hypothetical protein
MTSAVSRGTGAMSLTPFAALQRLPPESPLIYFAIFETRKWHADVFQLVDRSWSLFRHVMYRVLVAQPIGALDCVEEVPVPVVCFVVAWNLGFSFGSIGSKE